MTGDEMEVTKKLAKGIKVLYCHDDADGLTSGVLMVHAFPVERINCPEDFGVWNPKPDPAKNYIPPDVVTDMVPKDPSWEGICIDHHPSHAPSSERKYILVWDSIPATGIVYKLWKNRIPKEYHWKVAIGLSGDGMPEIIPTKIWKSFPNLLDGYGTVSDKYGKVYVSSYPVFLKLSSYINSACKIENKWQVAYQVLKNAKDPLDIIEDPALIACKEIIREDYRRIIKESHPLDFPYLRIWRIASEYKIERTVAWKSYESSLKTTLVINTRTGRISIRGVLASFLYNELQKVGYDVNGHPGFGGGKLKPNQTVKNLVKDLRKLKLI